MQIDAIYDDKSIFLWQVFLFYLFLQVLFLNFFLFFKAVLTFFLAVIIHDGRRLTNKTVLSRVGEVSGHFGSLDPPSHSERIVHSGDL